MNIPTSEELRSMLCNTDGCMAWLISHYGEHTSIVWLHAVTGTVCSGELDWSSFLAVDTRLQSVMNALAETRNRTANMQESETVEQYLVRGIDLAVTMRYWYGDHQLLPLAAFHPCEPPEHPVPVLTVRYLMSGGGPTSPTPPFLQCTTYAFAVTPDGVTYATDEIVKMLYLNPLWLDTQYPSWRDQFALGQTLDLSHSATWSLITGLTSGEPDSTAVLPHTL